MYDVTRRQFMRTAAAFGSACAFAPALVMGAGGMNKRPIPATGEQLPVIGMGTWQTFDVDDDAQARSNLARVLQAFFDHGGAVIDSSPMYGSAEQVVGDLIGQMQGPTPWFAATKVWTRGRQAGIDQMHRSMQRMRVRVFDLMQIHNLVDWQTHLETLKDWKAQGKVRYIGITTSHGRDHADLEKILATEPFDFVQFTYSLVNRAVESRLLPLAQERGIATLINRPYEGGRLFQRVKSKSLPDWAREFDCQSWGQFFLKFVVSHPGVTCAIPATSKVEHMVDNMQGGVGKLPDADTRDKMRAYFESV